MALSDPTSKDEVLDFIRERVWLGCCGFEAIYETVVSNSCDTEAWVAEEISQQFLSKRQAEQLWPEETDCDRLERAFITLENFGVICLHAPADDMTSCLGLVRQAWINDGKEASPKLGYAVYSRTCIKESCDQNALSLEYGVIPVSPLACAKGLLSVDIGHIIIDILSMNGFKADFGTTKQPIIRISPFEWRKRSPVVRN